MALYTAGRRRVILALLLTSVLLITLDLRGNPVLDRIRDGFARIMDPVEAATDVVTLPAIRAWKGITEYDDVERENQALRDQLDRLIGTQASAELSVLEYQRLRALLNLPSLAEIPTEVAQVVGASANNLDQIIEINKGRTSGIRVGMPVVNQAGLIGKIHSTTDNTAKVMLITDARYTVPVRVQAIPADPVTVATSPSGRTEEQLDDLTTTTTAPPTTLVSDVLDTGIDLPQTDVEDPLTPADGTLADGTPVPDATDLADGQVVQDPPTEDQPAEPLPTTTSPAPGDEAATSTTTAVTTTTTTVPPELETKEFGALEGRGRGFLPQIRFLQDNPGLAVLRAGDIVVTAGGFDSLAPSDIPVGVVVNRADRPGPGGPLLDVEPHADLSNLTFVRVVIFSPELGVEQ